MIQPSELLVFLNLDQSLDDLTTYQHCYLEFSVGAVAWLTVGGLFALADFGVCRPKWLKKVQDDVTPPLQDYSEIFVVGCRNFVVHFMLIPFYAFWKDAVGYNTAPPSSWIEVLCDFAIFLPIFTIWFYLWHRLVHIPPLYGYIHKMHHKFKTPIAFEGLYFSVIDMFMGNIFPIVFITLFTSHSQWTILMIYVLAIANSCLTHSGYYVPLLETGTHDAHHEFFNVNYGAGGVWMDMLFGTYRNSEDIQAMRDARKRRKREAGDIKNKVT